MAKTTRQRLATALARRTSTDRQPAMLTATVVALGAGLELVVNLNGRETTVLALRDYVPYVGDTVILMRRGLDIIALGSVTDRGLPDVGLVAEDPDDEGLLRVDTDRGVILVPHSRAFTPAPGMIVALEWRRTGGYAAAELSRAPAPLATVVPSALLEAPPRAPSGAELVLADDAAGWTDSGWDGPGHDLQQAGSVVRASAWFYGGTVRQTIIGRTIDRMTFTVPVLESSGGKLALYLHQHATRMNALPAARGAALQITVGPGTLAEVELPDAWLEAFAAGPCGIRTAESGAHTLMKGPNASTLSGALTIEWSR